MRGDIIHSTFDPVLPGADILVVDDERVMCRTLQDLFTRLGYNVTQANSGREAVDEIRHGSFDLVLLDLQMPGMCGTEVLETTRPLAPDTIFIILTAYGTLDSAIVALHEGAFDYLLKPTPISDIIRVVEAGLEERKRKLQGENPVKLLEQALVHLKQRTQEDETVEPPTRFLVGAGVTLDLAQQLAVVRGEPVSLTPSEYCILCYLMRHRERVISARELVHALRGYDLDERDARDLLRSHVHRLRKKIELTPDEPTIIVTVRGKGYRFYEDPASVPLL